jgi:hypothetical protein
VLYRFTKLAIYGIIINVRTTYEYIHIIGGFKMSCPYVIFVGNTKDTLEPVVACSKKERAIEEAKELQELYACVEAIFMPEDNIDTNDIIYANYSN